MKNIKILTIFIFAIFIFFASYNLAKAADLTVDCIPGNICTITPVNTPLFQESNWPPGSNITRNITVKNEDTSQSCDLLMSTANQTQNPPDFSDHLLTNITNGSTTFINGNLTKVFTSSNLPLGTISPASQVNYAWTVTLDPNTSNAYQKAGTNFDFTLAFTCDTSSGGSVAGSSTSSVSAPTCDSQTPTSAPVLTGISNSANTVNLTWTSASPADHYMIRYGTSPGNYIYGASDIGNVTSFLVQALSGETTYYFQVAGVNNCAPGPWSNELKITVGGKVLPPGPAQGFTNQVLGVATSSPNPSPSPQPQTLGTSSTCSAIYYYWWIPLVIQALVSFLYIWKRWKDKVWWIVITFFAVLSQIIHQILGCNCATGSLCPYYWIFNLLILFLSIAIYLYQSRKEKN